MGLVFFLLWSCTAQSGTRQRSYVWKAGSVPGALGFDVAGFREKKLRKSGAEKLYPDKAAKKHGRFHHTASTPLKRLLFHRMTALRWEEEADLLYLSVCVCVCVGGGGTVNPSTCDPWSFGCRRTQLHPARGHRAKWAIIYVKKWREARC